jgi:quinol-cytochrome oxidoreductase complex cytochrome b subunit
MSDPREAPRPAGRRDPLGWFEQRLNLSELFSIITHFGLVYTPIDTTRPIGEVLSRVSDEPVESFLDGPRVLGLLAAIVFGLQCISGLMLAFYYLPTPEAAYDSTRTIVRDIPFGWFIHQTHTWGAWVLGTFVVLRLLRLFWDGVYRAPREVLWFCAVAMAWLVLQMDFTGRLMTWNTHSYWSVVRGTEVVYSLPVVGPVLAFLLGGRDVNQSTLIRFYVLHVMVLPLAFAAGIFLTFATLRRVGLAPAAAGTARRTTNYRRHLYAMGILLLVITGVMATLTVLVPFRFAAAADPYTTPGGVRPPWYMLAPYMVMQSVPLPRWITGGLLVLAAFAVLLLPLLEKRLGGFGRDEKRMRMAGAGLMGLWIALSVLGALLERR